MKAIGKAIVARRALLATLSGVTLIAVALVATISVSQRQPLARATARHLPSMTYQVSVTSTPAPGATAPATQGASTTTATSGAGQATPTPRPASHSGGSIAWPISGDASFVVGSYAVSSESGVAGTVYAQVQMLNICATTWSVGNYYLECVSNCMDGYALSAQGTATGQSETFTLRLLPWDAPFVTDTLYSQWAMFHFGVRFGAIATIQIVSTTATLVGSDPAPSCDTNGLAWAVSRGTCANGGLELTTNSAHEPIAALQAAPASFDDTNYRIEVSATFSGPTGAWMRVIANNDGSNQCVGQGMDVQSDGEYRLVQPDIIQPYGCVQGAYAWTASSYGAASITLQLYLQPGQFSMGIDGIFLGDGGTPFTGGYPIITVGGTDGAAVTVTSVVIATPVPSTTQWSVLQNRQMRM